MRAFRDSGAHRRAMRALAGMTDEAAYTHLEHPRLHEWDEAQAALRARPLFTKVRHPSPEHAAMRLPAPARIDGGRLRPR